MSPELPINHKMTQDNYYLTDKLAMPIQKPNLLQLINRLESHTYQVDSLKSFTNQEFHTRN